MVRYRKYRKYKKAYKLQKYSNETQIAAFNVPIPQQGQNPVTQIQPLVANTATEGMRKVKNFTICIQTTSPIPIQWALIYVPEGTANVGNPLNNPNAATVSLYEPNQNVIMSGAIVENDGAQIRITILARNLNSGDQISLYCSPITGQQQGNLVDFYIQLNYAISY